MPVPSLTSRIDVWFARLTAPVLVHRSERALLAAGSGETAPYRRPTDLRWSSDGARVFCAAGELLTFSRTTTAPALLEADSAVGHVCLDSPGFKGVDSRPTARDVISVDPMAGGRVVILRADGELSVGERSTRLPGAKLVRAQPGGSEVAVVIETAGESGSFDVVLLGADLEVVTRIPALLPLASVAWSPDGSELAVRAPNELRVYDPSGALSRTVPILLEKPATERSSRLEWTTRGIVFPSGKHLVCVEGRDAVRVLPIPGGPLFNLSATRDGRFAAVTSFANPRGLHIVDLETEESGTVPWASYFWPDSPIAFSPTGDALLWGDAVAMLTLVPWGEVAIDAATGLALDPEQVRLDRFLRFAFGTRDAPPLAATATDEEIRQVIAEVRTSRFRNALQREASMALMELENRLDARRRESAALSLFRPPESVGLAVGDTAQHPKFGEGLVKAVDGSGDSAKVTVAFVGGDKTLRIGFLVRVG